MTRGGVITAHLLAVPAAIVLFLVFAFALAAQRPADVQLRDTYFVVAHFHVGSALAASALVATLVARRYGAMNSFIVGAWALLTIHLLLAMVQGTVGLTVIGVYVAIAGLGSVVIGMIMSAWTGARRQART